MSMIARMYRSLYRIRRTEEEIVRVYPTDKIKSPIHLSIGQEAIAVGVCDALHPKDAVFGSYRGHAMYLAKGGDLRKMIAELYGKATGCTKGRGGSMHLMDTDHQVMFNSAVVGTTIPTAVGYALANRMRNAAQIAVSFFGEGATEEGVFQESLNFAALKRLPILFVCENNGYAIHAPLSTRQANTDLCARVVASGVPAKRFASDDPLAIREYVAGIAELMRTGASGPHFIECMTYRWKEHVGPAEDFEAGYRSIEEARPWMEQDQVRLYGEKLDSVERERIQQEVETEIQEAFAFAESSPFPGAADLHTDVYQDIV